MFRQYCMLIGRVMEYLWVVIGCVVKISCFGQLTPAKWKCTSSWFIIVSGQAILVWKLGLFWHHESVKTQKLQKQIWTSNMSIFWHASVRFNMLWDVFCFWELGCVMGYVVKIWYLRICDLMQLWRSEIYKYNMVPLPKLPQH